MRVYQFRHIRAPGKSSRGPALTICPRIAGTIVRLYHVRAEAGRPSIHRRPGLGARPRGCPVTGSYGCPRTARRGDPHARCAAARARRSRADAERGPGQRRGGSRANRARADRAAALLDRPRRARGSASPERGRPPPERRRRDEGLSERQLPRAAHDDSELHRRARALGPAALERRPGREDRDHRRRRRPRPSLLQRARLPDAPRLPEGEQALHRREGDRRPRLRAPLAEVEVRAAPLRPVELGARDPRGRDRGRQLPHARRSSRVASPASRRRRTSATTRC